MRQSACLVFNPIMVDNYVAFFKCPPVGRAIELPGDRDHWAPNNLLTPEQKKKHLLNQSGHNCWLKRHFEAITNIQKIIYLPLMDIIHAPNGNRILPHIGFWNVFFFFFFFFFFRNN